MNTYFNTAHLRTIVKIQELAIKHNYKFCFSIQSSHNSDLNSLDLNVFYDNDKVIAFIDKVFDDCDQADISESLSRIQFELIELNSGKTHLLSFTEISLTIELMTSLEKRAHDFSQDNETINTLRNLVNWNDYNDRFIHKEVSYTTIKGFGNEKEVKDNRVYRNGMALHFFAELVCDLLGEPKFTDSY